MKQPEGDRIIRVVNSSALVSGGGTPALSEIINRSLVHIQKSKTLTVPVRRAGEECELEIAPGVKIVMCWIPPGAFMMGSLDDEDVAVDDETQHLVTISQGYWLGKYQVTQEQWSAVMGCVPRCEEGPNFPAQNINWNDISGPGGFLEKVNCFYSAEDFFFLPTEAQWEYACRAGTATVLNSGKNLTTTDGACPNLDEVAWYGKNSGFEMHPVGQKKANSWGLHDMHGNVWEWCADWSGDFTGEPQIDPQGPVSGSFRVIRGGSFYNDASSCVTAFRSHAAPDFGHGFRLACRSVLINTTDGSDRGGIVEQVKNTVHVNTSKTFGRLHRIGEHEICWPDYQLVCSWAEQLHMLPVEVLMILLYPKSWSDCPRTSLFDGHFVNLVVDRRLMGITGLLPIEGLRIENLDMCQLDLCDLELFSLPSLKGLWCWGNKLTDLDLSPVPNLEVLCCWLNQITALDISSVPNLKVLDCQANELTDLDLSPVPNLTDLACRGNKLTGLDLSPVPELTTLDYGCTKLQFLDLSVLSNLKELNCDKNELTNLDLSQVPSLKKLHCNNNQLEKLDLSQVPNLTFLWCHENQLTDLNLSSVPNLENLSCGGNKLTGLDISSVPNLEHLSCPDNQLSKLNIRSLHRLKNLNCGSVRLIKRNDQNFK